MLRTRVGYCGGQKQHPTYRDLGDHTETIEIDFDPTRIRYEQLLEVFWSSHNACRSPYSRQYMSAIFYHDAEQLAAVHTTRLRCVDAPEAVKTAIVPYEKFWLAEDYHQKYRLRHEPELAAELLALYDGDERAFVVSTAAARINGWLDGFGDKAQVEREIDRLGLSADAIAQLRRHTPD